MMLTITNENRTEDGEVLSFRFSAFDGLWTGSVKADGCVDLRGRETSPEQEHHICDMDRMISLLIMLKQERDRLGMVAP